MGFIYKLTFSSGKSYIGLTTRTVMQRLKQHRTDTNKAPGNGAFVVHAAWLKYGEPVVETLCEAHGEDLKQAERDAIRAHGTLAPDGYNLILGGDLPEWSEETRKKMGDVHRGKPKSAEQRAKMSAAHKGRAKSGEHRAALSVAQQSRDPATRYVIGPVWLGKKQSAEHRAKKVADRIGVPRTAEVKAKISDTKRARAALKEH